MASNQWKAGFGKGEIRFPQALFPAEAADSFGDMVNGGMKYMQDRLADARSTFEARSFLLLPGAAARKELQGEG